ncbi:Het-C domain-containing protein [Aspergillus saccharolyticus JOP 1030-1]|uniref:Het-C-domain-containing protein n=1 Tax=Aspergillus saccharolyticus JOP 1030-1 TaxID=1450539 RepID=A0A318Z997_9EURO|nr:Het-C-domain-containing protein [Aspergillus saccharolyticus JOP 1030-1]PYH43971.1 Het-C-domain-containing protein [Aspergillus saccharolyticus JOP 1030-1]
MAPQLNLGSHALLILGLLLVLLPTHTYAFGAGNIASISAVEGKNWRHGDIEDMLKTVAFIKGHKWTSTMVKRVYFGNWLRDYSQAMDVGTLKSLPADTIRILVWILSFMTFGYATAEFEVTSERLGVYRPEEHIDNPKDYADNQDARQYDKRLRGPIRPVELEIDPETGMKNYIANERGDWTTSSAYIKYSLARSIHYGRTYTHGRDKGNEADLCEALRCLGQGLHTLEDFAAHTNYCELALREMGFKNVFPHTGVNTESNVRGHRVFPLVTGTFGMVDFFHSVLGEATDHFTQSEVNEMDIALGDAQNNSSANALGAFTNLLGGIPGTKDLVEEAEELKRRSEAQASANRSSGAREGYGASKTFASGYDSQRSRGFDEFESQLSRGFDDVGSQRSRGFDDNETSNYRAGESARPHSSGESGGSGLPDFDANKTIKQIYPILEFRDKVVRKLTSIIEKIPGLEAVVEKITETLTVFIMSLLAPFIRPIINAASKSLQAGSSGVIDASGQHQYEPWTDPDCTDPTHSMLSKDHFANILNEPAGQVASAILKYVAPRVLRAWENINISEDQVVEDCLKVFHHPALRDNRNEAHRSMFEAVESWVQSRSDRGSGLNDILSAEGVRAGKNTGGVPHTHGGSGNNSGHSQQQRPPSSQQQQQGTSSPFGNLSNLPIPGISNLGNLNSAFSNLMVGGSSRNEDSAQAEGSAYQTSYSSQQQSYQSQQQYQGQSYSSYEQSSYPHQPSRPSYAEQTPGYEGSYGRPRPQEQRPAYSGQSYGSYEQSRPYESRSSDPSSQGYDYDRPSEESHHHHHQQRPSHSNQGYEYGESDGGHHHRHGDHHHPPGPPPPGPPYGGYGGNGYSGGYNQGYSSGEYRY